MASTAAKREKEILAQVALRSEALALEQERLQKEREIFELEKEKFQLLKQIEVLAHSW